MSLVADLRNLVTYNPHTVRADASIKDVIGLLDRFDVHHVPVVDERQNLLGMISEVDIGKALVQHGNAAAAGETNRLPLVGEFMTRNCIAIDPCDSPRHAALLFLKHGFHSLPIVQDQLIGVLTDTDFLREFSYGEWSSCRDTVRRHMASVRCTCTMTDTREAVEQRMQQQQAAHAAVMQDGRLRAMISERDLRRGLLVDFSHQSDPMNKFWKRWHEGGIGALIKGPAAPLSPDDRLSFAAGRMFEARSQVLPVVSQRGELMGMITERGILRALVEWM